MRDTTKLPQIKQIKVESGREEKLKRGGVPVRARLEQEEGSSSVLEPLGVPGAALFLGRPLFFTFASWHTSPFPRRLHRWHGLALPYQLIWADNGKSLIQGRTKYELISTDYGEGKVLLASNVRHPTGVACGSLVRTIRASSRCCRPISSWRLLCLHYDRRRFLALLSFQSFLAFLLLPN